MARQDTPRPSPCPSCNGPEHKAAAELQLCWEGKARMAQVKQQTGGHLTGTECQALQHCPNPTYLTPRGYE